MKYYDLAKTDLKVSEIALGCMRIADKSVEEVEELVKTALDCGINFFDHADIYSGGKSEKLFGQVLEKHPEYVLSAEDDYSNKVCHCTWETL